MHRRTPWPTLVALILLAFALRVNHLGDPSLRGDEAFAVRYWAQSPAQLLRPGNGLAWVEPHPLGTFFSYWAWKALVGDTEFAIRMLSTLVNVIGVPAMYAFARRLLHSKSVALIAAFLWAINPNLIWHSQDARDYATWAAISVLSFWLLLSASDRGRRIDWLLYIVSVTLGLYIFFLEAFIVVVHGLYIVAYRRSRFRQWLLCLAIITVLLVPWFGQLWALAHSGYHGTATSADPISLAQEFLPALLFGENLNNGLLTFFYAFVIAAFIVHLVMLRMYYPRRALAVILLYLFLPTALLYIAATRLDILRPRYLIAVTPALLLPLANTIAVLGRGLKRSSPLPLRTLLFASVFLLGPFTLLTADSLSHYSSTEYHNPTNWKSLRAYLDEQTTSADTVIMTSADPNSGATDPAFWYYYSGPANIIPLPYPGFDSADVVRKALDESRSVWFIPIGAQALPVRAALRANGMIINRQVTGSFLVAEYRSLTVQPDEIDTPLKLTVGSGQIDGYTVSGELRTGGTLSLRLYWQTPPTANLTAFVHVVGVAGSPVWAQNDHPPTAPGRDVYLIDLASVPAGTYAIQIGLYDTSTGKRVPIVDGGQPVGDSTILTQVSISG